MNILIRADSSSQIGTGHIMRDLVLAKKFKNDNITFACIDYEGNLIPKIEQEYKVQILKTNEIDELQSVIKKLKIEMLIIDNYSINYDYEKQLKQNNPKLKLFVLDDTYEKHYCDILLNHNIYAQKNKYKDLVPSFCELKCGKKHTLLRDEFLKEIDKSYASSNTILVAMGGADIANLNIKIAKSILKIYPKKNIEIVTTTINKNLPQLKEYATKYENIQIILNTNDIAQHIKKSDFVICTPSVVCNEVIFLEKKLIAIEVAKNQKLMSEYLQKNQFNIIKKFNKNEFEKVLKKTCEENILVTSISSKIPLLKTLKKARDNFNKNSLIYGGDISENILGRYYVDKFYKMKRVTQLNINELIKYCKNENIKYIIPTRDEDLIYFSKFKQTLEKENIFCFVNDEKTINICNDKLSFYKDTKTKNIIPTYEDIESLSYKSFVLKDRFGSGSKSLFINIKKDEAIKYSKNLQNPIFQPFIDGVEYSIDSFVTKDNKCIDCIIRSRDIIIDGESKVTTIQKNKKLKKIIKEFLLKNNIKGHSITQVIKNEDGYHIIECNARFGGASTLSYKMGLKSFLWFLQECNGEKIKYKKSKKRLKQIRVPKDIYIEC